MSRRVLDLVENHISYFAMHTNFDVAQMGTLAAQRLMLTDLEVLEVTAAPAHLITVSLSVLAVWAAIPGMLL